MKKFLLISVPILLVGGAVAFVYRGALRSWWEERNAPNLPNAISQEQAVNAAVEEPEANANAEAQTTNTQLPEPVVEAPVVLSLPEEINLDVPFTVQAPHANWAMPYQEACEEASGLMVHRYWADETFSSADDADAAILDLVAFENDFLGFYEDTTAEEFARVIRAKWGYGVDVVYDPTIAQLKAEVADGYPVILPADGKTLPNPNFRNGGPLYHMLVVKGYLADGTIITNDPGTRKGADFLYDPDALMAAVHDWNGGDVPHGRPVMIVVRG